MRGSPQRAANRGPTSDGALAPLSVAPWHDAHDWRYTASPRVAWASEKSAARAAPFGGADDCCAALGTIARTAVIVRARMRRPASGDQILFVMRERISLLSPPFNTADARAGTAALSVLLRHSHQQSCCFNSAFVTSWIHGSARDRAVSPGDSPGARFRGAGRDRHD